MQGRRKAPFVGATVPLNDDSDPILYKRYTEPASVVRNTPTKAKEEAAVEDKPVKEKTKKRQADNVPPEIVNPINEPTAAVVAPEQPGGGEDTNNAAREGKPQKQRKKARWTDEQKQKAREAKGLPPVKEKSKKGENSDGEDGGEDLTTDATTKEAKKNKKEAKKIVPLKPEERISGPSNADEAGKIRNVLGFTKPDAPTKASFGFGFGVQGNGADAGGKDGSSSDSDDSSSEDDEEERPAAAKEAGTVQNKEESSSSSDDSDSSSDEDEEEDEKPQPKQATFGTTVAPARQQQQPTEQPQKAAPAYTAADLLGEFVPRRVYVGGMPFSYTEDQVGDYWSYCGEIESLDILTFPDTGRFRGIAFITFKTEEAYQSALVCDGEQCDGQTLKVQKCKWSSKDKAAHRLAAANGGGQNAQQQAYNAVAPDAANNNTTSNPAFGANNNAFGGGQIADQQPQRKSYSAPAPKTAGYNVAYVGNLAYEADEAAIRALFEPCNVTKIRIHTDKDTGRPKGFAHVHVADEESLDRAVELDGTPLMGRKIRVGYAQPKKEQGGGT